MTTVLRTPLFFIAYVAASGCTDDPETTQAPPPGFPVDLHLAAGPLRRGETAVLTVRGAHAGERVYLIGSPTGAGRGPCFAVLDGGCVDVLAPMTVLLREQADGEGRATLHLPIPTQLLEGQHVWLQAWAIRAEFGIDSIRSNVVEAVISTPQRSLRPTGELGLAAGEGAGAAWSATWTMGEPIVAGAISTPNAIVTLGSSSLEVP